MQKSCLTEAFRRASAEKSDQESGVKKQLKPLGVTESGQETCPKLPAPPASKVLEAGSEVASEIQAIFSQGSRSFSWSSMSFFACSPPSRSDNPLARDRTFAETRCIPITSEGMSPSTSASALSTA